MPERAAKALSLMGWVAWSFCSLTLAACDGPGQQQILQCQTAFDCVAPAYTADDLQCGIASVDPDHTEYRVADHRTGRAVIATVQDKIAYIDPNGNPVPQAATPAPVDYTVTSDQPTVIGCKVTPGPSGKPYYESHEYTLTNACFADACNPDAEAKPIRTRAGGANCEALCDSNDASCIKETLSQPNPLIGSLQRFNNSLAMRPVPAQINIQDFISAVNLYNPNSNCTRSNVDLTNSPTGIFLDDRGSSCPIGFSPASATADHLEFWLPPEIYGPLSRANAPAWWSFTPMDTKFEPLMILRELPSNHTVQDPVVLITGNKSRNITITGKNYYCARVSWPG